MNTVQTNDLNLGTHVNYTRLQTVHFGRKKINKNCTSTKYDFVNNNEYFLFTTHILIIFLAIFILVTHLNMFERYTFEINNTNYIFVK